MANLPSAWIWVVGFFAPIIASVLLKKNWDGRIKQLIAFALSIGLAFLVMWLDGSLAKVIAAGNLPAILGAILGEAEFAFKQVWEPHLLTTPIEKKATAELKEVLYVDKAVPVILAGTPIAPDASSTPSKEEPV
jgi:hypothetical protein